MTNRDLDELRGDSWVELASVLSICAMLIALGVAFFLPPMKGAVVVGVSLVPALMTAIGAHASKWTKETL